MKRLFFTAIGCVFILLSCSDHESNKNDKRVAFKYNEMSGITSLDPAAARSFENIGAVNQLFNGLVEMDDSLNVKPSIARSWDISPDGKTYTFHLRTDVFFHDDASFKDSVGRKVTADDFVHSFFRLFDSRVSGAATLLTEVDRSEKTRFKGMEAPDDSTFVIYLKRPFPPFLNILTMKFFSVLPYESLEKYGEDFRSHPIGTGPFKFKFWDEGSKLVMLKNEKYFEKENGAQLPYLDAVVVSFIKDRETSFIEFMSGNLDMVSGMDAINKEYVLTKTGELKEEYEGKFVFQKLPFLKTDYLGFLVDEKLQKEKNSPLLLKEVRQAISYGFDRNKMVKVLRGNLGKASVAGFVPPGLQGYDEKKVKGYSYDPDKARELLSKAGFEGGKGLPELSLYTTAQYLDLCEFIQSQLSEIGIKVKIEVNSAAVVSEAIATSQVNFFRKSWIGDYPDAENFLSLFYSKNFSPEGFNYTHFKNKKYDDLYEKALMERIDSVRINYYREMDQLLIDEAPVIPLYYDEVVRLVQTNVQNLTTNPMNMLNLKRVKKKNNN